MNRRRRPNPHGLLVLLLSLVLVLAFPVSAGAGSGGGGPRTIDASLVKKLKDTARGSVNITVNEATSFASFIKAGRNGDLLPGVKGQPQGKAKGFIKQFGGLLGVANADDLVQVSASTDKYGATHVIYAQKYRGLPVFGGILKVHIDAAGDLTAVNGTIVPAIDLATDARLSIGEARARAIAAVKADPPTTSTDAAAKKAGKLRAESARLLVYRTGLVKGEAGTNELVYHVVVTNGANIRDAVFVNANTGKLINRYSMVDNALHRVLYEQNTSTEVWEEGDPFPGSLNVDQQNILNFTEDSYNFFLNAFGRLSYDGADAFMRSVNNDPSIQCPNANWNGSTTNYCNGVTSDDVVAHEWGHAYTQYTHDLIYQWQPGALNESYSDIWGETVDLLNGVGTDSPGGARTVGACTSHTPPIAVLRINTPASIAGDCPAQAASFGPPLTASGTTGNVVLALDAADAAGPSTTDGCSPLTNAAAVSGKVAILDRGTCAFTVKVKNAQNAGAIAVIVANNAATGLPGMGGADATITIPSVGISRPNGDKIKAQIANTVNVTLTLKGGASGEDSYRWLMGEDSTAFGGAIRDMWNPTCMGDPGKVTDAEYHCDPSDGGGVHSNSGVPNHGYALLVDGGTYNGQTVTGIGLTKAAHIYWQAQFVYQTPTSKFADHADALEMSCTDLIGAPLNNLSTETLAAPTVYGDTIDAADCADVTAMIAAVEFRTDPTQCNFQPLLGQNPPTHCAAQKNATVLFEENFEDGLAGWTATNEGVFTGWPNLDWTQDTLLPGDRAGTAAFAEDLDAGNCDGGAGDISGVMHLDSPEIYIPDEGIDSTGLLLRFDHYVATEAGYDGGNVKISRNGGVFVVVPASAFIFNPYNGTLLATNPLAGEPGFTGTDGGEVHGSWGQSQIDLRKVGVKKADTIVLRFDFGMDGCGGVDGWYIDDIKLTACNLRKKP